MKNKYDFCGWATRNNLRCSDGRTIMKDAFAVQDGETVPLVWDHQHHNAFNVLGHALLENRDDGVYAYCTLNDTSQGENARKIIQHGDVKALSIFANQLKQRGGDVLHGVIREVSLVLAGANPGAAIESVSFAHGDDVDDEEAVIYTGWSIELAHADAQEPEKGPEEDKDKMKKKSEDDETIKDVVDSMNEKQKTVMYALIGEALSQNNGKKDEGGSEDMKHNIFENEDRRTGGTLTHSDIQQILDDGKRIGSLKEAVNNAIENGVISHALDLTGMDLATGNQTYGFNDPSMLFPDHKTLNSPPEWLSRDMDWAQKVIGGVHHTPFARIKSVYANITEDEARAKGYIKGKQKKEEVFTTLKRTTTPQTIYKKQKLDRDDIIDITDFDVVNWIRSEMRVMLDEEIARAILIGDGRPSDSDDKISEEHVRPIATDKPLFNTKVRIGVSANPTGAEIAKNAIDGTILARKHYKGSGNPVMFTTEDYLTEMLLLEDGIGHKLYKTEAELATTLRVSSIVTVEAMEGREVDGLPLIGVIVNLKDYNVGADKGGEINTFDDFDIDYNQYKYLIETRISGALVKPFSALTLLLEKSA